MYRKGAPLSAGFFYACVARKKCKPMMRQLKKQSTWFQFSLQSETGKEMPVRNQHTKYSKPSMG